jgi:intraflagellar transport protein 74
MAGAGINRYIYSKMRINHLKTIYKGAIGTGRMVQDRTFFQSELRQKLNMLVSEINKMNSEGESIMKENSNYAAFEKRADMLADEIKELQGQLGDLNTLVDKLHTDSDLVDIERQQAQLKSKNQRESQVLDEIFVQRQQKENLARDIEKQIEDERKKSEAQINELPLERRNVYFALKDENLRYLSEIQKRQSELDAINSKIASLQQVYNHVLPYQSRSIKIHFLRRVLKVIQTRFIALHSTKNSLNRVGKRRRLKTHFMPWKAKLDLKKKADFWNK